MNGLYNGAFCDNSLISLMGNGIGPNLWPTSYVTYIYNHVPNADDIAPADIFNETKCTCHKLKYGHV